MQFPRCPRGSGRRPGAPLTTLFGTDTLTTASAIDATATAKKRGWLPLLTVLFLISYGLMTMLIVEQGETIESQRALIRALFRDSTELSAVKMKSAQDSAQSSPAKTEVPMAQNPSVRNPSAQVPSTQAPSTQYPSTQASTAQAPSSQAGPQHRAQNQSAKQKPDFKMPSKPEPDLVDDVRTLITI